MKKEFKFTKFGDFMREYLNEQFVIESLDTTHKIVRIQKGNPDFYYFNIDENEFRVFVEKSEDSELDLHIGFEYYNPNKGWMISGIQDILSAKNVLGIFGTVFMVLKTYKFNSVMFCSNEPKKFRTYLRLMDRLSKVSLDSYSLSDLAYQIDVNKLLKKPH